ncbi:MAG TPA: hypothetical protein VFT27_08010, partial [Actinomycetota bacterium]|nr:hypothetical protein [Actinomycetota bacterium]
MNDVERELRRRFAGTERRLTGPDFAPSGVPDVVLHRARRRQVTVVLTALATAVIVAVGSIAGALALLRT